MPKKKPSTKPPSPSSDTPSDSPATALPLTKYQRFTSQTVHRSQLKNAPYNPSRATKTQLAKLREGIKRFGFVGGITWNRRTENLVGGHKRLSQLDALNGSPDYHLTVDVVDLSEADEIALNILLNNREAQGNFDLELLSEALAMLSEFGGESSSTGFSQSDLQAIMGDDFLAGVFGEQASAEQPIVSELAAIHADAAEQKKADLLPSTPVPPVSAGSTPEQRADLKRKRDRYRSQAAGDIESDADFSCVLVFNSNADLRKFLQVAKLPADERYFDGHAICRQFGVLVD